jgi:PAS domain S-box-containing protein
VIAPPARSARILVVEDSEVQALQIRSLLEGSGYEVDRVASAEAAMESLNENLPDLIVADLQLPKMDGRELTRQLRLNARTRAIPVLIMTSDKRTGERSGLESGADAFVEKSRDPQTLLLRVNALLRGRQHNRSLQGTQLRRARVYVLDSSKTRRLQLQDLLSREGYDVSTGQDVEAALAQAAEERPDCYLVNLLDTKFDGVETCRQFATLRDDIAAENDARQPFVVLGVGEGRSAGQATLKAAFAVGCDDVVSSNSDDDLLRLRVRALVRRHLMMEEAARLDAERDKAREALEQFRMLVEGVSDYALYMLDPDGRVATWNNAAERIKGYSAGEIIGRHFSTFYTDNDRDGGEPERALRIARERGRYETEAERVRKDGTRFWAHVVIDSIYAPNGKINGYAKITRDVTERRRASEELQATREALTHAQKMEAIGQLTGGIAHDFNNMLAGIIGAMNLVRKRIADGRAGEAEKFIDAALTSANRAASLTSRLLAFGRRQTLDLQPIEVNGFISSMRILLDRAIGENVSVKTEFNSDELWALTDASQLESAILNLAINARDAMPEGGTLTIETRALEPSDDARHRRIAIVVRDDGAGMTPEVLAKVFDPFFTTKPVGQGTGLGLSMVYGFVSQSGGDVQIDSTPGIGTTITLCLPAAAGDTQHEETAPPLDVQPESDGETVLVVEDDAQVRMLILEVLRDLKYHALEASSPEQALALIDTQRRIDLMISDVGLPGLNGRQLAEIARSRKPGLKILFITGYVAQGGVRGEFLEPGMDMLMKPFALDALTDKIREMIHSG